ncbi:hypothetical protein ACP70R_025339 [Stipagrostis hirtigluma subsp. patula]
MSRRSKPAAANRRTRDAEQPQPPAPFAGASRIMSTSNPIFHCETGPSQPNPPGDQLRCVYGPASVRAALVHDPDAAPAAAASSGGGIGKPLPPPPYMAHRAGPAGAHRAGVRVGPALVVGGPRGRRGLRRAPRDPFLAAYVACRKTSSDAGGGKSGGVRAKRPEQREKKGVEGDAVRGCGVWNGWAAGAKCATRAMSCRHGCAVAAHAPAAGAAKLKADAPEAPTLDLSWAPAVLSARAMERRPEHR